MPVNVFISHAWGYSEHYRTLANWIFNTDWEDEYGRRIRFADTSVPQHDPIHVSGTKAIEAALAKRIAASQVVVAPAGLYATHSNWIAFELNTAKRFGVPVIQINPRGQQRLSLTVKQAADYEVGWTGKSVVNQILNALR